LRMDVPTVVTGLLHDTLEDTLSTEEELRQLFGDEVTEMVDAGAFLEWAEVHGNCYGTARSSLEQATAAGADILLDIDFQGAEQLRNSGLEGVFIFILPPDMNELRKRLDTRNTDDDQVIERRMKNAVDEIAEAVKFDYLVVNDLLGKAVETILSIMTAETARTKRVIDTLKSPIAFCWSWSRPSVPSSCSKALNR
ncbi:MAG: HD domain-containing protein, partial [Desulfuromonadales bacterium]